MAQDYSAFTLDESVVPAGNAGRGSVNPPLIGEPQPPANIYTPPAKPVIRPYSGLPPAAQAYQAAIEGGLHGLTAGTSEYGKAGLSYLVDRFRNWDKSKTFKEQLAETRERTAMVKEDNPNAYAAGDVAGAVGLGILTRGKSLPATMATQGASGAIRSYSESPETTLSDAAQAGGTQALLTGALGLGGKALNYGASQLEKAFEDRFIHVVNAQTEKLGRALKPSEVQELYEGVKKGLEVFPVLGRGLSAAGKEIKSGAMPAALGAGLGATGAAVTGNDPLTGAAYGATGAFALSKANAINILSDEAKVAAGRMAIKSAPYIGKIAPYVTPTIAGAVSPAVTKSVPKPELHDYSSFEKDE